MSGPDGWRFARVQWSKGIHASRRIHYYERGVSLCGDHHDGYTGWYTEALDEPLTNLQRGWRCKKCLKKLARRGEA